MSTTEKDMGMEKSGAARSAVPPPAASRAGGEWERPVAMAKDRNVRAWLIFLGLICLGVALWTPLRALYYRFGFKQEAAVVKRDGTAFVAIAYYGVSGEVQAGSQDISKEAFARQLKLLRENGYTPIGLDDVRAFYKENKPLPRKAILMTFEQARRSSYFEVRELLREYKWRAVMGVNTAPIHAKDAQALLWPYLQDMLTVGTWDLAAESDRGFIPVKTSPSGQEGSFFSHPMWMEDRSRYELPEEFNARIEADHQRVIQEFSREVGVKPSAFFFPYGDYGQYDERAHVVRVTNLHQVGEHYDLGFILGQLALNTHSTDPRRLNRLLVNPQWSAEMLVTKLESFWPKEVVRGAKMADYDANAWIGEWGDVFTRNEDLVLRAVPPSDPLALMDQPQNTGTTGAKAWLAGSDLFQDGYLSVRFQHKRGRFGVYLRATSEGDYVYFGMDDTGKLSVRQKLPDIDELILASDNYAGDSESGHELLLCIRGNLFFARLDGQTLFGGRVLLGGESKAGLIGIGVWDKVPGTAGAVVLDTRMSGRRDSLVLWSPDVGRDISYLSSWLNEHGYQFTVFAPPWLDIFENAPITFPLWDRKSLKLIARTNGARILPHVQVRDASLLLKVPVEELITRALENDADGLYVDTSACVPEQVTPLVTWLIRLNDGLREKKLRMALKLPLSIESLPSAGSIIRLLPDVLLVGDYQTPPFDLSASQVLEMAHVPPPASDETVSLYYQISQMMAVYNDISPDAQNEELRQKGFDAFTSGDYEEAIKRWMDWSQKDTRNAEPLSLIGDAWLRLNQPDKALSFYSESLTLNPGQVNLAIRYSRLLEQNKRTEESSELLNVYARAFPDSPAVTIAQAQWLDRHRRREEAREVMRDLVKRHPDNIEARLVLQTLLDVPAERYANMQELMTVGSSSETQIFGFGRNIFSAELLTIPEASVFFDFVRDTAWHSPNKRTRELYQGFLPLTNNIVENFIANKLSDNWVAFGGFRPTVAGRYELRAGADMSEAFLRLKRSELLRDGFIEVTLDESVGSFWLYARRSSKSMIRYGYDEEGFIRIQSWFNGDLRTYESKPWLRPPGSVRLRLEVRGDGAVGYVNDKITFTTPLSIPPDVCYGWWSVAPYSPELGMARARIARIECGPLAPTLLLLPKLSTDDARTALDVVRSRVRDLSALAPVAFTQLPDGTIPSDPEIELAPYRMFCTFHRLRLIPVIDLTYFSQTSTDFLAELILKHRLSGIILRVRMMPDEEWFAKMEKTLERTSADCIVLRQEDAFWPQTDILARFDAVQELLKLKRLQPSEMREIQRGSLLLHPVQSTWTVPAVSYGEWSGTLTEVKREKTDPALVVFPRQFLSATNDVQRWIDVLSKAGADADAEASRAKSAAAADVQAGVGTVLIPTNRTEAVSALTNRVSETLRAVLRSNEVAEAVSGWGQTNVSVGVAAMTNGVVAPGAVEPPRVEGASDQQRTFWQRLRTSVLSAGEGTNE